MSGPRRWLIAGMALIVASGLTAVSTWRHWTSCRNDVASLACTTVRDATHGFPGWGMTGQVDLVAGVTATAAAALLGVTWILVIGWSRRSLTRSVLCVVIGVQPIIAAVLVGVESSGHPVPAAVGGWATWPAEVYVFPLLLGAGWLLNETPLATARLLALGWGVTSFGSIHHFADYVITRVLAPASPGLSPPGLGYVTATTQLVLGLVVILLTVQQGWTDLPDTDEWPGRDDYRLAA